MSLFNRANRNCFIFNECCVNPLSVILSLASFDCVPSVLIIVVDSSIHDGNEHLAGLIWKSGAVCVRLSANLIFSTSKIAISIISAKLKCK